MSEIQNSSIFSFDFRLVLNSLIDFTSNDFDEGDLVNDPSSRLSVMRSSQTLAHKSEGVIPTVSFLFVKTPTPQRSSLLVRTCVGGSLVSERVTRRAVWFTPRRC